MKCTILVLATVGLLFYSCQSQNNNAIEESLTSMDGIEMTYKYTEGNSYNLKFDNDSVSYRFLTGPKPKTWWGPFKCNAIKKENGEYFLSWYEHGYGDYITLLLDADKKTLWGSGIIIKNDQSHVHFQKATISEFKQN